MTSNNLIIKDAKLIYKNFSGKETEYNDAGNRNFSVIIEDPEVAQQLLDDGWNLKPMKARDEDEEPRWHLSVRVRFDNFPPRVIMRSKGSPNVELNEETISTLDNAHILNAHVNINPSRWNMRSKSGVKAYLKSAIIDIEEDELLSMLDDEEMLF